MRIVMFIFLALLVSVEARAQVTTKLSIPRRQILGLQEFATPSPVLAGDVLNPDDLIFISLDLQNATRTDTAVVIHFHVFVSRDDGATWTRVAGGGFTGDPALPSTTKIGLGLRASDVIGARVKVQIDSADQRQIGLKVEIGSTIDLALEG